MAANVRTGEASMLGRFLAKMTQDGRRPLPLRKNFAWSLFGKTSQAFCQWVMVIAIAKLQSPDSLGEFVLAISLVGPIVQFATLQLRSVQVVESEGKHRFGHFLALRTITLPLAFFALILVLITGEFDEQTCWLVLALFGLRSINSLSGVVYGLLQRRERLDRVAMLRMFTSVSSLLTFVSVIAVTDSLLYAAVGMIVARVAVAIFLEWPVARWMKDVSSVRLKPEYEFGILWRLARLALPLTIAKLFYSLQTYLPRYFVQATEGDSGLAFFASMTYFALAGSLLTGALVQASAPTLARHFHSLHYRDFMQVFTRVLLVCLVVGCIGFLLVFFAGPQLLTIAYTAEYSKHQLEFQLIIASMAINLVTSFLFSTLRVTERFSRLAVIRGFSVSILCLLLYFLVPSYGIRGAAISLLICALVDLTTHGMMMWHCISELKARLPGSGTVMSPDTNS